MRLSACPVCEPAAFDGALDVAPLAIACLKHASHPIMQFFLWHLYETASVDPITSDLASPTAAPNPSVLAGG